MVAATPTSSSFGPPEGLFFSVTLSTDRGGLAPAVAAGTGLLAPARHSFDNQRLSLKLIARALCSSQEKTMFRSEADNQAIAAATRVAVLRVIAEHGPAEASELVRLVDLALPGLAESDIKGAVISLLNRGLLKTGTDAKIGLSS
jgi:hypothetical protein